MTGAPSERALLEAQAFRRRRLAHALVYGDPEGRHARRPWRAALAGLVLAGLLVAGLLAQDGLSGRADPAATAPPHRSARA